MRVELQETETERSQSACRCRGADTIGSTHERAVYSYLADKSDRPEDDEDDHHKTLYRAPERRLTLASKARSQGEVSPWLVPIAAARVLRTRKETSSHGPEED